jgi:hypothetical protein
MLSLSSETPPSSPPHQLRRSPRNRLRYLLEPIELELPLSSAGTSPSSPSSKCRRQRIVVGRGTIKEVVTSSDKVIQSMHSIAGDQQQPRAREAVLHSTGTQSEY